MSDSTRNPTPREPAEKPKKPYPDFPLTPHASGKWMKKIRGAIHYFGAWAKRVDGGLVRVPGDGWEEALAAYREVADDLHAGRTPRVKSDGLTVADLCNRFLTAKLRQQAAGELTPLSFMEYRQVTDLLVSAFGKGRLVDDLAAGDFERLRAEMAERWGPVRLGNGVTRIKGIFKYGTDNGLIERAVRYGTGFRKPGKAVLRKHKAQQGEKLLTPEQLHTLLRAAGPQMNAMMLLGLNCGFGNSDVATLPLTAVNLDAGWINFPRPKTGIPRRCPLWPETVEALRGVIASRREPMNEAAAKLVFLTSRGTPLITTTPGQRRVENVSFAFSSLLKRKGLHRPGFGFYTLRHVFRTVADGARDPVAIDLMMGHADPSMGAAYRERVEDDRLRAVAEHVRQWLFGDKPDDKPDRETPESDDAETNSCAPEQAVPAPAAGPRPTLRLYVG
jgi:integrase